MKENQSKEDKGDKNGGEKISRREKENNRKKSKKKA